MAARILSTALLVATAALARTDLEGCTYYDSVVNPGSYAAYATRIWYVPGSGEICEFLDCGGGRAPPKTTVPGCAAYEGTATYSPHFLDPKAIGGQAPETTAASSAAAEASEAPTTEAPATTTTSAASSADETDETEIISASASDSESAESPVASETSSASASKAQHTAGPETTTSVKPQQGGASNGATPATSAPASSSTAPDNGAAALPAGAVLGSWVAAGVAAWAGMM